MIVILDTDHLTVIQRKTEPGYSNLRKRLQAVPERNVCTTIISFEEQMHGWLSLISKAKAGHEVAAYKRLRTLLEFFAETPIVDYDDAAARQYSLLRRSRLAVGSMDLKIASIALSKAAILLTCNTKDFARVPKLTAEDWTRSHLQA